MGNVNCSQGFDYHDSKEFNSGLIKVSAHLIYNSQKLERTQLPLNRGMDTENVVHLHNGVQHWVLLTSFTVMLTINSNRTIAI
jgi:hypothetical protein